MKTGLLGLILISASACVSSTEIAIGENTMPGGWSLEASAEPGTCVSIAGDYQVLGSGKLAEGLGLEETRLDAALGHTFPTNNIPERVMITVDEEASLLSYQFTGSGDQVFSETVSCSDGWYVFEQKRSKQYVGDGTSLDYLHRKVSLGKGNDDSLIVHLRLEGQFSSYAVVKSREATESWSRFKMIK